MQLFSWEVNSESWVLVQTANKPSNEFLIWKILHNFEQPCLYGIHAAQIEISFKYWHIRTISYKSARMLNSHHKGCI